MSFRPENVVVSFPEPHLCTIASFSDLRMRTAHCGHYVVTASFCFITCIHGAFSMICSTRPSSNRTHPCPLGLREANFNHLGGNTMGLMRNRRRSRRRRCGGDFLPKSSQTAHHPSSRASIWPSKRPAEAFLTLALATDKYTGLDSAKVRAPGQTGLDDSHFDASGGPGRHVEGTEGADNLMRRPLPSRKPHATTFPAGKSHAHGARVPLRRGRGLRRCAN